jgi:hypothetical protein
MPPNTNAPKGRGAGGDAANGKPSVPPALYTSSPPVPDRIENILRTRFDAEFEPWQLGFWIAFAYKQVVGRKPKYDEALLWAEWAFENLDVNCDYVDPEDQAEQALALYDTIHGDPLGVAYDAALANPFPARNCGPRLPVFIAMIRRLAADREVFILPQKLIAGLFGVKQRSVSSMITRLKADGVLIEVNPEWSYTEGRAKEYKLGKLPAIEPETPF